MYKYKCIKNGEIIQVSSPINSPFFIPIGKRESKRISVPTFPKKQSVKVTPPPKKETIAKVKETEDLFSENPNECFEEENEPSKETREPKKEIKEPKKRTSSKKRKTK